MVQATTMLFIGDPERSSNYSYYKQQRLFTWLMCAAVCFCAAWLWLWLWLLRLSDPSRGPSPTGPFCVHFYGPL